MTSDSSDSSLGIGEENFLHYGHAIAAFYRIFGPLGGSGTFGGMLERKFFLWSLKRLFVLFEEDELPNRPSRFPEEMNQ